MSRTLEGLFELTRLPSRVPRLVRYFRIYRDTRAPSGVSHHARRSRDTVKNSCNTPGLCVCKKSTFRAAPWLWKVNRIVMSQWPDLLKLSGLSFPVSLVGVCWMGLSYLTIEITLSCSTSYTTTPRRQVQATNFPGNELAEVWVTEVWGSWGRGRYRYRGRYIQGCYIKWALYFVQMLRENQW